MTENATARMEGKVVGITDKGISSEGKHRAVIDVEVPGSKFTKPLWSNTEENGGIPTKDGKLLAVGDYLIADYIESEYINKKTNQPTTSRWVYGVIEVVEKIMLCSKTKEITAAFTPAVNLTKTDNEVTERSMIFFKYYEAVNQALGRRPTGEECGFVSTLFIDHMKDKRIKQKYGQSEV